MNDLNRIHKLIAELAEVVGERFPEYTDARFTIASNGHMTLAVTEWEDPNRFESIEKTPRRYLCDQTKLSGTRWRKDDSKTMNDWYRVRGILLERRANDEGLAT